jgi:hypothetical protein
MGSKLKDCPTGCGGKMRDKVLVDSDDRIHQRWSKCDSCGYDTRKPTPPSVEKGAEDGKTA